MEYFHPFVLGVNHTRGRRAIVDPAVQILELSYILFITVFQTSLRLGTGLLWKLLYTDDVIIIADNLENAMELVKWREAMQTEIKE